MAPTPGFYINDIMAIISDGFGIAHVVFWIFFIQRYKSAYEFTANSEQIKAARTKYPKIESWFKAVTSLPTIAAPITFEILSTLFLLLACCLNYQSYSTFNPQSNFYLGLTDANNPSRQWYYVLALVLVCVGLVLIPFMDCKYRGQLKRRFG